MTRFFWRYENFWRARNPSVDINQLLRELVGQRDRIGQAIFHPGERVYVCTRCRSGYREESWEFLGRTCEQCRQRGRVEVHILPIPPASSTRVTVEHVESLDRRRLWLEQNHQFLNETRQYLERRRQWLAQYSQSLERYRQSLERHRQWLEQHRQWLEQYRHLLESTHQFVEHCEWLEQASQCLEDNCQWVDLEQFFSSHSAPPITRSADYSFHQEVEELERALLAAFAPVERERMRPDSPNNRAFFGRSQRNIDANSIQWIDLKTNSSTQTSNTEKEFLMGRSQQIDINQVLIDLIGQRDRVSQEILAAGEKIYVCTRCQSGYHEDSWDFLGRLCEQCGIQGRVQVYTLPVELNLPRTSSREVSSREVNPKNITNSRARRIPLDLNIIRQQVDRLISLEGVVSGVNIFYNDRYLYFEGLNNLFYAHLPADITASSLSINSYWKRRVVVSGIVRIGTESTYLVAIDIPKVVRV